MGYIQQMRHIILPQAMQLAVPPTVAYSVQIVKATALTSIIGFVELSRAGAMISNATFRPMEVYGIVVLIYFLLCWPLSKLSSYLEQRLNVAYRNH
ncbi:Binding-protein-dependent transport system inner membrane component [Paracoccus aminovorans]|uniref:Binding-protein-dependent transport system inner membrane component n=1 Tax=Paracoccus aminovorans TaxID=34004 RepID=A0A1I3EL67_9RHOB|nr:ABC transporter permease subunit [Paracoccus aminovorans]CQR87591.1 ABC-type amino acid transport system, permease component [Paracoccus aminovorans]SFH99618.1 Binding-protein-dependent transport system inner membrane component [Paracoccus aminovorans]